MQREEARKKFREAKERRSGALRSKAARYTTPSASVRINGLLETPYSPDRVLTRVLARVLCPAGLGIAVEQQLAQFAGPSLLEDETDEFPVGDSIADDQVAAYHVNGFDQMIDRAAANGMPPEHLSTLREILDTYPDVWHTVPYRSPPRKYAPLQAQFIREYVQTSVDNGLVEQNNASRSASDVVPVRKPGTQDQFRLTIDYRSVNGMTVPIAGTMPSVATTTDGFQNKKVFGRVDFTQGFWQLPLDEASRAIFTFITPDGVFTPCRVPQGAMDSTLHFQSQVQTKLAPLIPHSALVWVYDVILFAPTVQEFLMTLRAFFEIVKLNMAKSSLIELECLWGSDADVPTKVRDYVNASGDDELRAQLDE
ncbi:Gag/polymerase/env Polyprotein [Phytophthora cinnamomi]|uniref:Gag/polymerase/env Polyprotein n=1 Tax=Phytophthora cinnamomi TaxID=4785 RepID=UPI003559A07B|nr:Gag/polymerase/env Polyprotein [Phytophthora cinnamomi]